VAQLSWLPREVPRLGVVGGGDRPDAREDDARPELVQMDLARSG
jgi:hypothetical protein